MFNKKIAVLGDLFVDIQTGPIFEMPDWNSALMVKNIKVLLGGSAGNTARYLGCYILNYNSFCSFKR